MNKIPNHLAIIMDGNSRWAYEKGVPQFVGHKKGVSILENILEATIELGIPHLSLYSFSTENWQRGKEEVDYLLGLLSNYLNYETQKIHKNGIKLKVIGNFGPISKSLKAQIQAAEELTKDNTKLVVYVAFSYGGRQEIIDVCQKLIDDNHKLVTEENFKQYLYSPNMPDVDLLIRTSGVFRISNFLLWQIAYAELYFCEKYWPDFNKNDLIEAVNEYSQRTRNFGRRVPL